MKVSPVIPYIYQMTHSQQKSVWTQLVFKQLVTASLTAAKIIRRESTGSMGRILQKRRGGLLIH